MESWRPGDWPSLAHRRGRRNLMGPGWSLFDWPFRGRAAWGLVEPAVDVFETDEHMVVKAELPGIDPADIKVSVTEDSVSLRGETKEEHDEQQEGYHWRERRHGLVQRMIPLTRHIDPETAKASFRNGVLTIRAEKAGTDRGRSIHVQVENEQEGYGRPSH